MFRGGVDTFVLVINYLDEAWTPRYVIDNLFEVHETTSGNAMILQFQFLLQKFELIHWVIAFEKHESSNLGTMATSLQLIINCELLKLLQVYERICFGHVTSKTCQYVMNDDKVLVGLILVNVKDAQIGLQKIISRIKKSGKGKQKWEKACIESGMWHQKLKTPVKTKFASKVIMLEETLEFKQAILLCYGKQKTLTL